MKYLIIPEGGKWIETEAQNPEAAYRGHCCWYNPGARIAVIDTATNEAAIFTRQLDPDGNLIAVNRVPLQPGPRDNPNSTNIE